MKVSVNTQPFFNYVKWLHVSAALCIHHQAKHENCKKKLYKITVFKFGLIVTAQCCRNR